MVNVLGIVKSGIGRKAKNVLHKQINKRVKSKKIRGFLKNQVDAAVPYLTSMAMGGQSGGRRQRRRRRTKQRGSIVAPPEYFPTFDHMWRRR